MAKNHRTFKGLTVLVLVALACVPILADGLGQGYYVTFFSRVLIMALAAVGLNLILGYGGLVSMGHALYVGVGVYTVGILSAGFGIDNGWVHMLTALAVTIAMAVPIGLICLRTSGMAFIMITLAFGQMAFFGAVSLSRYGGDDGMAIPARSDFGILSLANDNVLYGVIYLVLVLALLAMRKLVRSPFGLVLQGIKLNERRMTALGYPTLRYKLVAYVISALLCALAGMLLANLVRYMSPSYMLWQASGELVAMVVLGGMATIIGPVYGALALLVLEEALVSVPGPLPLGLDTLASEHPMAFVGIFIVLVAIGFKRGLHGMLSRDQRDRL